MPSSPNFDDAMFVLSLMFKSLQANAHPENNSDATKQEIAWSMFTAIGMLGHVFAAVAQNGELPTNSERRKHRLLDLFRGKVVEYQEILNRRCQKPSEN